MRAPLALLALFWASAASALTPEQQIVLLHSVKASQSAKGTVQSVAVSDNVWTSSTDLTPVSQYVNGWTVDATIKGLVPGGVTSDYLITAQPSCSLSFTDQSPGYDSSANATTVNRTICATSWLRQTYANSTLPTEATNGGNGKLALTLNDFIYQGDSLGSATSTAGWYSAGGTTARAGGGINVTNSSTRTYPRPICAWVTPPGERVGTSGSLTVEMFCGHAYAQGGIPVAAVVFTLSDGTHTASHTVSSLTASARQFSTSCTATLNSNQLTSCGSTVGLQVGERMTVPGIPGQPKISALTSSTITFSQVVAAAGCTPKTNGEETITGTPGVGEGLGDGAFVGQTITDANLNTNPATITTPVGIGSAPGGGATETLTLASVSAGQFDVGSWISYPGETGTAQLYISALGTGTGGAGTYTIHCTGTCPVIAASTAITGSAIMANPGGTTATSIKISTNSASGSAVANACTINHLYKGVTGTVTATLGNPVPIYSATFSSSDFSTMTKGAVYVRAQVYPIVGNVVLDTQTGADGTNCDWFYIYDTGSGGAGVCDSGNAAFFATTGLNVSPNLHNLWAYNDTDNSYAPAYVWVSGSAGGSPAVQSTAADPGSSAYYASAFAALANIKTVMNARTTAHNDINGVVLCYVTTGTPYTGFGGNIGSSVTASKPGITVTSATIGQNCPASGSANANLAGVTFGHNATTANLNTGPNGRINNLTISDTADVFVGSDLGNHTTFLTSEFVFNNDKFVAGATSPLLFTIGVSDIYNSFSDESAFNGSVFSAFSTNTNTNHAFFNTIVGGSYSTQKSSLTVWTDLGNNSWGNAVIAPSGNGVSNNNPIPTGTVVAFNRFEGLITANGSFGATPNGNGTLQNLLVVNNIWECMNRTGTSPCLQISADTNNVPLNNVVRMYDTAIGARTNFDYLEGIPQIPAVVASGGALAAGTYFSQTGYARVGNPTVETSTDGPTVGIVVGGTGTDSLSYVLACDPNYVFYLYIDTTNPPTHAATVGGVDAKQIAGCQTVTATAIGGARTPPTVAGTTGHNEFKTGFIQRFTLDYNCNNKRDTYNGSGATNSGGRVGSWEGAWRVGWLGTVCVSGTVIGSGYNPNSGLGEIAAYLDSVNSTNSPGDATWVTYTSDKSYGGQTTNPVQPASNTGEGDYCPANSTNVGSRVPSGFAAYPWDIGGTTRKNDGTGYAGAFESGCL